MIEFLQCLALSRNGIGPAILLLLSFSSHQQTHLPDRHGFIAMIEIRDTGMSLHHKRAKQADRRCTACASEVSA